MPLLLPLAGSKTDYLLHPGKIIAMGLNYQDHIEESVSLNISGSAALAPSEPVLFPKTPNTLLPPGEAIRIPQILQDYPWAAQARTDYEGELAVILGKGGKNIPLEKAEEHILGFTCMNDVSQRNIQTGDKGGWFRGKSFDTFGPIGPVIVPWKKLGDPQNLDIETRLNGKTVQKSNTRHMIFPLPFIVHFISRQFTLEEGDLILTGTPSGVGPLSHGDVIEISIQGIGTLSNPVVDESWSEKT